MIKCKFFVFLIYSTQNAFLGLSLGPFCCKSCWRIWCTKWKFHLVHLIYYIEETLKSDIIKRSKKYCLQTITGRYVLKLQLKMCKERKLRTKMVFYKNCTNYLILNSLSVFRSIWIVPNNQIQKKKKNCWNVISTLKSYQTGLKGNIHNEKYLK